MLLRVLTEGGERRNNSGTAKWVSEVLHKNVIKLLADLSYLVVASLVVSVWGRGSSTGEVDMFLFELRYAGLLWSIVYCAAAVVVFLIVRKTNKNSDGPAMSWFVVGILGVFYTVGYVAGNSTTSVATIIAGGLVAAIGSVTSVVLGSNSAAYTATDNSEPSLGKAAQGHDRTNLLDDRQRKRMVTIGVFLVCLTVGELCGIWVGGRAKDNLECVRVARESGKELSDVQRTWVTTMGNVGAPVPLLQSQLQASPSGESSGN